jgi:3-oxoacyl-[acyl-carrier-protein] synthase-3
MEAIENSGVSVRDIDLLIVATATPDRKAPSVACSIQARLGVCNAVAFDINAVCSGFLYGMSIAEAYFLWGVYDTRLVIGVDVFSRITDWNKRDSVFFGDGAGPLCSVESVRVRVSLIKLYSDGRGSEGFTAVDMFKMDKRAVYDAAVTYLTQGYFEVLDEAGLTIDDIDVMIPHQPSIRVLKETAKRIGLPWKKVKTNMDRYANTAAATIPILLDEVRPKGSNVLFAAMGSGWTYGAAILDIIYFSIL